MLNSKLGSLIAVVGTVDPVTVTTVEQFTDVIDLAKWDEVMAIAVTGDMSASTFDFQAYTCVAAGTSAVALKNTTQLASSATANDNAQLVISVSANEVASLQTGLNHYVKFGIVSSGSGGPCAVVVIGIPSRTGAVSANDLSSVLQIKN